MLISIAVITYNSSEFIIDLLDSIKRQTWKEIELIVSDDFSTDNTLSIVSDWLNKNGIHFVRTQLITHSYNIGITRNLNDACHACYGDWIKVIGGDDIFEPNAIELFANVAENSSSAVIFSGMTYFSEVDGSYDTYPDKETLMLLTMSGPFIMKAILDFIVGLAAPAALYNNKILREMNYFDERFLMGEDYPYYVKCLDNGFVFDYRLLGNPLIKYRQHKKSTSSQRVGIINKKRAEIMLLLLEYSVLPRLLRYKGNLFLFSLQYIRQKLVQIGMKNKLLLHGLFKIETKIRNYVKSRMLKRLK